MTDVTAALIDTLDGRGTREPVPLAEFMDSPAFKKLKAPLIGGTYSVYSVGQRHKYVDLESWRYTTTELSREYLRGCFANQTNRKRVGFNRQTLTLLDVPPPYYFGGSHKGNLAMVDISSCYWQLYSPLTLDAKFNPWSGYVGLGSVYFDNPEWLEAQRKSLKRVIGGGIIRSREMQVWTGRKWEVKQHHNKLLAPELWGLQMFTLHYVAREVIKKFGAYYWNVDGCIVDADKAQAVIDYLADEWKLRSVVKMGPGNGEVRGVGSYDIYPHVGKRKHRQKPVNNFDKVPDDPGLAAKLKQLRKVTVCYL